jgi:hypothetical protein
LLINSLGTGVFIFHFVLVMNMWTVHETPAAHKLALKARCGVKNQSIILRGERMNAALPSTDKKLVEWTYTLEQSRP